MSLSSRTKNKIVDLINTTFASLGHANGMRMPKSGNNLEPYAWDLWLAHHVLSLATKRKEQAEKAAIAAGVIIDKEKHPRPGGTREVVFNGDVVSVSLEVRYPSARVDAVKMAEYLTAHGVSSTVVSDAMSHATTMTKPAHVFSTMLITNGS
jgi:hypothetical protein